MADELLVVTDNDTCDCVQVFAPFVIWCIFHLWSKGKKEKSTIHNTNTVWQTTEFFNA